MKLLTKSEIDSAKARDRQLEVSEGLKLAKRVDSLREVHAQEEASLEKFRVETLTRINEEIKSESQKLDSLKGEISKLEKRRLDALKPLDEEWVKVRSFKEELDSKQLELSEIKETIQIQGEKLDVDVRKVLEDRQRVEGRLKQANEAHFEADQDRKSAHSILESATLTQNNVVDMKVAVELNALEKIKELDSREKTLDFKEQKLKEEDERLKDEARAIKDRYETLERTITRLKK